MKKLFLILCLFVSIGATANDSIAIAELQEKIIAIQKKCNTLQKENKRLEYSQKALQQKLDSLQLTLIDNNHKSQQDIQTLDGKIKDVQNVAEKNNINLSESMKIRSLWGIAGALLFIGALSIIVYLLHKRINKGTSAIDKIKDTQKILQEESLKLDNKLLEVVEKQMNAVPLQKVENNKEIDHSLALKVADEIVRIEMNLSRMDASVKGYKQLSKAVSRIKDNFNANGYEIVDMLGKPYVSGMKAAVTFVTDENLEQGKQIITKIIKPQINYQQQMIQAAQIEVSQSE